MTERELKRVLNLPQVTFYGLGTILGAGIYVLVSAVAARAGSFMPFSFVLAGIVAAFSAFSFAALSARLPLAGGEAVYVHEAYRRTWFTRSIGYAVLLVGIVSSATIAKGFAGYLHLFIDVPEPVAIIFLTVMLGGVAAIGISESVWLATIITIIEMSGLLFVIVIGAPSIPGLFSSDVQLIPSLDISSWSVTATGAFLAFYAFVGFEDMVNIAEEVKQPERVLPIAIITALVVSTLLYGLFSLSLLAVLPLEAIVSSDAPLATMVDAKGFNPLWIGIVGILAILNGALVQIIKGARVLYGMSSRGWAPPWFQQLADKTKTPVNGTVVVSITILSLALTLPIERLAAITSAITLFVFMFVNLSLSILKKRDLVRVTTFDVPAIVPLVGALLCMGLLLIQLREFF